MNFWRGEAYQKLFEYLDYTGGFYYEVNARQRYVISSWLTGL